MSAPARRAGLRGARARPMAVLVALGAGWGLTGSLGKIGVSTGHGPYGILVWQSAVGTLVLGALILARGRRPALGAPQALVWLLIALSGSVLPGIATYTALPHLPAGVMAIVIALIPLIAFPMALALGIERFAPVRLAGLALGLAGVALAIGPGAALPAGAAIGWLLVALIAPVLYAMEGVGVARWGTGGLDPVETLFGASVTAGLLTLPLALASGQWIDPRAPWGPPEWAILASSAINAVIYAAYVWLVIRAGATFAAQVSYLITGFGILWAMALLGERYGWSVWAALAVIVAGLVLVQPRAAAPAAPSPTGAAEGAAPRP